MWRTDTCWFQVLKRQNQNVPNSTPSVPSLFAIPVLLRCNQVYEFWLDQWFPNIMELGFTLNQGSRNSKNWVKEPTINCGFITWLFHENHQFFETETFGVLFLCAGGSAFFSTFLCRVKHQGGDIAKRRGPRPGESQAQPWILGMSLTLG
jgi:hypothetical protein